MRLDIYLVENGFETSRERAKTLIKSGAVTLNGKVITKPAEEVPEETVINITDPLKYVSRGGYKLEFALSAFDIAVTDFTCIDIGASTGGFTDCLLQHGAKRVYAVDVGTAQLAEKLRSDPRVVSIEQTDIREISNSNRIFTESCEIITCDFITCDVSFISITKILPDIYALMVNYKIPSALLLIKPQFEIPGRHKNGIIRGGTEREKCVTSVLTACEALGLRKKGLAECPVNGKDGNVEYFLYISV
jgi:23S rRNA (cytidine1920-2'-O)/16S rRNA (cytidine1409-2'-O)-methyltransferase